MSKQLALALVLLPVLLLAGCRHEDGKNLSQGEIHFSIKYDGKTGSIPKDLMPRNLVVLFKDDKITFDISAPIGNTGFSTISNPKDDVYDAYVSIFGAKYYYSGTPDESFPGFSLMDSLIIKPSKKEREIAGYPCKHAEVQVKGLTGRKFEIWYTDELKLDQPNRLNPFYSIDGVLMSFFYLIGETEMQFEVQGVYAKEIPNDAFERKEKYSRISKSDMDKIITRLIQL